jgi:hypothetical protein
MTFDPTLYVLLPNIFTCKGSRVFFCDAQQIPEQQIFENLSVEKKLAPQLDCLIK